MMTRKSFVRIPYTFAAFVLLCGLSHAGEWDSVPPRKVTTLGLYMKAKQVHERMIGNDAARTLLIDVRTPQEAMFIGMPQVADANVPYMVLPELPEWDAAKKALKLVPNGEFVGEIKRRLVAKGLDTNDMVILICRSGDRSAAAVNLLSVAGFTRVYSVIDGFEGDLSKDGKRVVNGWKNDGLPWSFELNKEKMSSL